MNIEDLKFPIGKYKPQEIKFDHITSWIKDIEELPSLLEEEMNDVLGKELAFTYRPEGWNIRQVVHHMADSHMNALIRFKLTLTEDNPTIKPYEEAKWALLKDVEEVPVEMSLLMLRGIHARWESILKDMSVLEFSKKYTHPEHGKSLDLAYTVGMYSWHGRHHLGHIKNAKKFAKKEWS